MCNWSFIVDAFEAQISASRPYGTYSRIGSYSSRAAEAARTTPAELVYGAQLAPLPPARRGAAAASSPLSLTRVQHRRALLLSQIPGLGFILLPGPGSRLVGSTCSGYRYPGSSRERCKFTQHSAYSAHSNLFEFTTMLCALTLCISDNSWLL